MVEFAINRSYTYNPMYFNIEFTHKRHNFHYKFLKFTRLELIPKFACQINKKCVLEAWKITLSIK